MLPHIFFFNLGFLKKSTSRVIAKSSDREILRKTTSTTPSNRRASTPTSNAAAHLLLQPRFPQKEHITSNCEIFRSEDFEKNNLHNSVESSCLYSNIKCCRTSSSSTSVSSKRAHHE